MSTGTEQFDRQWTRKQLASLAANASNLQCEFGVVADHDKELIRECAAKYPNLTFWTGRRGTKRKWLYMVYAKPRVQTPTEVRLERERPYNDALNRLRRGLSSADDQSPTSAG